VSAPRELQAIWTFVKRYGFADDSARERVLDDASAQELNQLVAAVSPAVFTQINAYLDETRDSEEAVPYGDLAQAAMEAAQVIRQRRGLRA
jgi:hypothetical protein